MYRMNIELLLSHYKKCFFTFFILLGAGIICPCGAQSIAPPPPCPLTAAAYADKNFACTGGAGTIIRAIPANGTPPYTYNWTPGSINSVPTNPTTTGTATVTSGINGTYTYTVLVMDNKGCSATASTSVTL